MARAATASVTAVPLPVEWSASTSEQTIRSRARRGDGGRALLGQAVGGGLQCDHQGNSSKKGWPFCDQPIVDTILEPCYPALIACSECPLPGSALVNCVDDGMMSK